MKPLRHYSNTIVGQFCMWLSIIQFCAKCSPYQHTEERKELFIHATKPVRWNSNHYHPLSSVLYPVLSFVASYVILSSPGLIPRSPMNLRMRLVISKQFYSEWWLPCGSEYYILGKYKVSAIALHQGRLQSLDWTSGLDWWNGLVDWHQKSFLHFPMRLTHL